MTGRIYCQRIIEATFDDIVFLAWIKSYHGSSQKTLSASQQTSLTFLSGVRTVQVADEEWMIFEIIGIWVDYTITSKRFPDDATSHAAVLLSHLYKWQLYYE